MAPKLFDPKFCFMMNLDDPSKPSSIETTNDLVPQEEDIIAEVFADGGIIEYKEVRISKAEAELPAPSFEHSGRANLPRWIQFPEIPICPRTNEPMLFLGEFFPGVPIVRNDVVDAARANLDEFSWNWYFEAGMRFWGGEWPLFAHYHPVGQSLCLHPQGT